MTAFEQYVANDDGWTDWVRPVQEPEKPPYKLACCDCGLVHDMEFRVVGGDVEFRVRRNNRSTGQVRRHMGGANA